MVQVKRSLSYQSLYWFLEEPLNNGARLDLCGDTTLWLIPILTKSKVVKMKDLIGVAGIALDNADALAQRLEMKSTRTV